MTQEELSNLEKQVTFEGDEEAIKKLAQYYKEEGDVAKYEFYEKMLRQDEDSSPSIVEESYDNESEIKSRAENNSVSEQLQEDSMQVWHEKYATGGYKTEKIRELMKEAEVNPFAAFEFAKRYLDENSFDQAIEWYTNGIKKLEKSGKYLDVCYEALTDLGTVYEKNNNYTKAFEAYQNATELDFADKDYSAEKKLSAYYQSGIGIEQNTEKANYYKEKYLSHTAYGCFKIACEYATKGKKITVEEWIDRARECTDYKNSMLEPYLSFLSYTKGFGADDNTPNDQIKNAITIVENIKSVNDHYLDSDAKNLIFKALNGKEPTNEQAELPLFEFALNDILTNSYFSDLDYKYIKAKSLTEFAKNLTEEQFKIVENIIKEKENDYFIIWLDLIKQYSPYAQAEIDDISKHAWECFNIACIYAKNADKRLTEEWIDKARSCEDYSSHPELESYLSFLSSENGNDENTTDSQIKNAVVIINNSKNAENHYLDDMARTMVTMALKGEIENDDEITLLDFALNELAKNSTLPDYEYEYIKSKCSGELVKNLTEEQFKLVKNIVKENNNLEVWLDSIKQYSPYAQAEFDILEKEKEQQKQEMLEKRRKEEAEREKAKKEAIEKGKRRKRKIIQIVAIAVILSAIFYIYRTFIYDGIDPSKALINSETYGYTATLTSNYGIEVKDAIVFSDTPDATFTFKKRYTTFATTVGMVAHSDLSSTANVTFYVNDDEAQTVTLNGLSEIQEVKLNVKGASEVKVISDNENIFIADTYLLDSSDEIADYETNLNNAYNTSTSNEFSLSDAFLMQANSDSYEINDGIITVDATEQDVELVFNGYSKFKSMTGTITVPENSNATKITIDSDDEAYSKIIDKNTTKSVSISLNQPQILKITVHGGIANLQDLTLSTAERRITTTALKDTTLIDSSYGYSIKESATSTVGVNYSNIMVFDGSGTVTADFKLGKKYKTLKIHAVAGGSEDYKVIRVKGDGYTLDKALIKKVDDLGYEALLNVENVDILELSCYNNVIISEATLSDDENLLDECKPRTNKMALYDMKFVDETNSSCKSIRQTELGATIIDSIGNDWSGYTFTVYPNNAYWRVYGTLYNDDNTSWFSGDGGLFRIFKDDELVYEHEVKYMDDPEYFEVNIAGAKFVRFEYVEKESKEYNQYFDQCYIADAYME